MQFFIKKLHRLNRRYPYLLNLKKLSDGLFYTEKYAKSSRNKVKKKFQMLTLCQQASLLLHLIKNIFSIISR